ncbi:MAG: DUF4870 domain-containing protein [Eudoraea sp.]|nr:DUF4870 domain-containing protein [Eudoraea sp.]MBT8293265.1 DUF4870 domain-containing protein [Eudoraea sp.]NNL00649.1 DUF4870 domain-containing protein [Eudoraea sp.]
MTETLTKHERNLSAVIHASTLSKYFIPFGNFLLPLVLWIGNKKEHSFVDYNGKQALNFQISLLLYSIILGIISVPFILGFLPGIFEGGLLNIRDYNEFNNINFHFLGENLRFGWWLWPIGITGMLQVALFIVNIVYTILATLRTNEGQYFKYPITINFIK